MKKANTLLGSSVPSSSSSDSPWSARLVNVLKRSSFGVSCSFLALQIPRSGSQRWALQRPQRGPRVLSSFTLLYCERLRLKLSLIPIWAKYALCAFATWPIESDSPLGMPLSRLTDFPKTTYPLCITRIGSVFCRSQFLTSGTEGKVTSS